MSFLGRASQIACLFLLLASPVTISALEIERPTKTEPVLRIRDTHRYLAFHPDGKLLVCGRDCRAFPSGKGLGWGEVDAESVAEVTYAAFSPDGKLYATVHFDTSLIQARHAIRLWEVTLKRTLRLVKTLAFTREQQTLYRDSLHFLAFSPDGKLLAVRGPNDTTTVWETATAKKRVDLETNGLVVGFTPDSGSVITVTRDGLIQHWNHETKRSSTPLADTKRTEFLFVENATSSADSKFVLVSDGYTMLLLDTRTGKTLRRLSGKALGGATFSPDGKLLAGGTGEHIVLLDPATGKTLAYVQQPKDSRLSMLAFSADSKYLAAGGDNGCWVWAVADLPKGKPDEPRTKPSPVTLEARLTSRKREYKLDLGGRSPQEFARRIKKGGDLPPAPKVELVLTLKNTGTKKLVLDPDISVYPHLVGKGAMNHPLTPYQTGVRTNPLFGGSPGAVEEPKYLILEPGQTHNVAITSLDPDNDMRSYWLLPGEYSVHAWCFLVVDPDKEKSIYPDVRIPPLRVKVVADKK